MPSTKILTINYYDTSKVLKFNNHIVSQINKYNIASFNNNAIISGVHQIYMISFTISSTSYQAESGMTWAEWCNSEYNTGGWGVGSDYIGSGMVAVSDVIPTDIIHNGHTYSTTYHGGGGGSND